MGDDRQESGFSLALGSGGARGLAHIGVLRVLGEAGLRPRAVAGTSMGAYVGAMYAAGVAPTKMVEYARALAGLVSKLSAVALRPGALLRTDRVDALMRRQLPAAFEDLDMPFGCIATDMMSGEPVAMTQGDLPKAVRASMSVPVLFDAVSDGEHLLSDGGLIDPVPVGLARALGGDPVVAVHVGRPTTAGRAPSVGDGYPGGSADSRLAGVIDVGSRAMDVQAHWLAQAALERADVVVTPDVGRFMFGDLSRIDDIVDVGARAARAALPAVRAVTVVKRSGPVARFLQRVVTS